MIYTANEAERTAGALDSDKLARIVADIRTRGFAVVAGLLPAADCELLMGSVLEDAAAVKALNKPTRHEKVTGAGHLQLGLRRFAPFVKPSLVANPLIEAVVTGVLGDSAWLGFYNGNVNLPGSTYQPLHFDRPFSWRTPEEAAADGQAWPPPATTLSCSVALTEITAENGATEIYPGTHQEDAVTDWPPGERLSDHPDLLAKWTPANMPIPAGGVCFRDPRMWHRGVPNPSDEVRPMIAITYHAAMARHWRGLLLRDMAAEDIARCEQDETLKVMEDGTLGDGRLVFADSARDAFLAPNPHGVRRNARFVRPPQAVNHFRGAHLPGGALVSDDGAIAPA